MIDFWMKQLMRLELGKQMMCLFNLGCDMEGKRDQLMHQESLKYFLRWWLTNVVFASLYPHLILIYHRYLLAEKLANQQGYIVAAVLAFKFVSTLF